MACSIEGITEGVPSEDKAQTKRNARKVFKASDTDRALALKNPIAFLIELINAAAPTYEGKKLHVLDLKRSAEGVFTLKYKVGQSPKVLETEVENFSAFMTKAKNFQLDHRHLTKFYSDFEYVDDSGSFETLALDVTNNPQKIMEVAEALIEADEYHNDEAHNIVLRQRLAHISEQLGKMMPDLSIHINNAGKFNAGKLDLDANQIRISKGVGGSKSLMEIYTHELYHAVTHFAISSADIAIRGATARIEKIRTNFLKNTTESDLMRMSGGRLTMEQASSLLDHLTDPQHGLHEFVALSMTNKAIMNQLKKLDVNDLGDRVGQPLFYRLLDAITEMFNIIASVITKEPRGDDLSRMVFLVAKLHDTNKKPLEAKRFLGIRNIISIFEPIESKFREYVKKKEKDVESAKGANIRKQGEGNLKWTARVASRALYDQEAADILGNIVSTFPLLSPEGTIRTALRDMREADVTQDKVDNFGMSSQLVDQKREFTAIHTAKVVMENFDRKLSEEEEVMLTNMVLDLDLSSIYFNYDMDALLTSKGSINAEIKKIIEELNTLAPSSDVNFYDYQTDLLANYMLNHEDHIALLKNASNIAKKVGTSAQDMGVDPRIVTRIDELATLKALKRTSKQKKLEFRDLMDEQRNGVEHLVAFQYGQKDFAEQTLFLTPSDKLKIIKGYSAQITDPDIDMASAPVSKEKEMKTQGYKLIKTLDKHTLDGNATPMGLYVSSTFLRQGFHRVAMRITDKGHRGTTITESFLKGVDSNKPMKAIKSIKELINRKKAVEADMMAGTYRLGDNREDGMVSPLLNNSGATKDFTYGLDKDIKIRELGMERKVSVVMGRTSATTYDKKETTTLNAEILKFIEKDIKENNKNENLRGTNNKEYIRIEKDSDNPEVKDLWSVLPEEIKIEHPKGFMVRRDLMHAYLGMRNLSITDLPGIKGFTELNPKVLQKIIKASLQIAEKLWEEIVKITKIDVIIRTPGVFIGNIVSNFILMYVSGYSFKEITHLKLQGVRELKTYVDGMKRSIELGTKKDAELLSKAEERELNRIENNLNNSPVKDLVDAGFYTTIIEEIEHGGDSGSYFNRLAKKKLTKVPKIFHDGFDMLYITENTKLFKLVEKGIQASDFAARYAQYHLLLGQGTKKQDAINMVRDNFINYNRPNSRFLEWANKMGFVMFTKYFTRIQRVLLRYGKTDPLKVILSILAQDYVFGELDTVDDQSIAVKDMGNLFYNPFDNLMRVITPSSLEAVDWAINGGR